MWVGKESVKCVNCGYERDSQYVFCICKPPPPMTKEIDVREPSDGMTIPEKK